jgi:hypothetical protein
MARATNGNNASAWNPVESPKKRSPSKVARDLKRAQAHAQRLEATTGKIDKAAGKRQDAWLEKAGPIVTNELTAKLEELYGEHREAQAGTLTDPYRGSISSRTWRSPATHMNDDARRLAARVRERNRITNTNGPEVRAVREINGAAGRRSGGNSGVPQHNE